MSCRVATCAFGMTARTKAGALWPKQLGSASKRRITQGQ